jgi:hypothetical protein
VRGHRGANLDRYGAAAGYEVQTKLILVKETMAVSAETVIGAMIFAPSKAPITRTPRHT